MKPFKKLLIAGIATLFIGSSFATSATEVTRTDEVKVNPTVKREARQAKKKVKRTARKAKTRTKSAANRVERRTEAATDRARDNVNR